MPKRKDDEEEAIEEQPDNKRTKLTSSSSAAASDSSAIVESSSSSSAIVEKPPASLHDCEVARFLYSECKGLSILPPELINLIHEYKEWHDESEGDAWYDGAWVQKEDKWLQSIGLLKWNNGDWMEGQWRESKMYLVRGKRTIGNEVKEGIWFKGRWLAAFEGKWDPYDPFSKGKLRFVNGHVYEGELLHSWRSGRGAMTFANGDKYEGEWKLDKENGFGEYKWASGYRYVGEWVNDMREGKGKSFLSNGQIDEGEWKTGHLVKGKRMYSNGSIYDGPFAFSVNKHVRSGFGIFYDKPKGIQYEGTQTASSFDISERNDC